MADPAAPPVDHQFGPAVMATPVPERELAQRLLTREAPEGDISDSMAAAAAAERVFRRLQAHLAQLIGTGGFHALLTRAIDRCRADHPLLASLEYRAPPDWPLDGLDETLHKAGTEDATETVVALVATFTVLLGRFIGDGMAARLMEQSWPAALRDNGHVSEGGEPHG